jgi:hypothetical protein
MAFARLEMLEARRFLSVCDGGGSSGIAAVDSIAAHEAMLRPLGYTYPDPGGGGGGAGNDNGNDSGGASKSSRDYRAKLRGANEVPARSTTARGTAIFRANRAGTSLRFTLKVSGINNVVAAHLHLGKASVNGPVVAHLFGPESPGGGARSGKIASGTIKARDLEGSLEGKALKKLINAIRKGAVYVNVHTDDGNGSSDTGAGDFASGEIRGQVKRG